MRIAVYAPLTLPFSPRHVARRPLGGSETALYHLTRELAACGAAVTVINRCGADEGIYDGVHYMDFQRGEWRRRMQEDPPDVLIIFRQITDVLKPLPGRIRILWAHDHLGAYPEREGILGTFVARAWQWIGKPLFLPRIHVVATVSHWLAQSFHDYLGVPWERILVTRNGLELAHFRDLQEVRNPFRLIYTSVPERGLDLLLDKIFPAIRSRVPEAELHVFSYRNLERYRRKRREGVIIRGGLPQHLLARELAQSAVFVYPTDFPETSCIAALEAQAAGTPVVTSKRYALQETVLDGRTGILIEGKVGSEGYIRAFVEAVVRLLRDPSLRERMGRQARERVLERYGWDRIAREWWEFLHAAVGRQ